MSTLALQKPGTAAVASVIVPAMPKILLHSLRPESLLYWTGTMWMVGLFFGWILDSQAFRTIGNIGLMLFVGLFSALFMILLATLILALVVDAKERLTRR